MSFARVWRRERWNIFVLLVFASISISTTIYLWFRRPPLSADAVAPRVQNVVNTLLAERRAMIDGEGVMRFGDDQTVNVLFLGLDSRKEGKEKHCDAIHMASINVKEWTVLITSVPRGTYSYIPPGNYQENEYYLANACAFAGLDYGVAQIERIIGVRADYVVKVGFSQTLGILRLLKMPTTEALQWLRHRQGYALGDPQRSQNQAVFMKDVALKLLDDQGISSMFFHMFYSFVDTNMSEETARALYDGLVSSGLAHRQDDIILTMKPYFPVQEMHFDADHAKEQIAALLMKLRGRLSPADFSQASLADIQETLVTYLRAVLDGEEGSLDHVIDEQLWRQVEDTGVREDLHYRYIAAFVKILNHQDHQAAMNMVTDYILEKQALGLFVWEKKGRVLLEELL